MWIAFFAWLETQGPLTVILTLGFLFYLVYRGIIKLPGVQVKIRDRKMKGVNPHAGCQHVSDFQVRVGKAIQLILDKAFLINTERIRLQMIEAEHKVDELLSGASKTYISLLNKELGTTSGITNHPDYKNYNVLLRAVRYEVLAKVRYIYKENHIPINEAEFNDWANSRAEQIVTKVTYWLDDYYMDDAIVDRKTVYKANYARIADIRNAIIGHFRLARQISIAQEKKCEELDKQINECLPYSFK